MSIAAKGRDTQAIASRVNKRDGVQIVLAADEFVEIAKPEAGARIEIRDEAPGTDLK